MPFIHISVTNRETFGSIGIAYNALPGRELQNEFQTWAKLRYKQQWEEMIKVGRRMNEYSMCQFKIDRNMRAEA